MTMRNQLGGIHSQVCIEMTQLCRGLFLPTNHHYQVWQLVRGAGPGPQAFGSTVKQTEEDADLQLPRAIVFSGRMGI